MELQALKAGRRPKDESLVEKLFQQAVEEVRASEASADHYRAYLFYKALVEDFKELREVVEYQSRLDQLKRSGRVRDGLESERRVSNKQQRLAAELEQLVQALYTPERLIEGWVKLRSLIKDLETDSKKTKDSDDRRAARRVLDQLFIHSFETAGSHREKRDYKAEAIRLEVAAEVKPSDPYLLFLLARAYAAEKRKKQATETLKRAVARGFCDVSRIAGEAEFEILRKDSDYQTLLEKMKTGSSCSRKS